MAVAPRIFRCVRQNRLVPLTALPLRLRAFVTKLTRRPDFATWSRRRIWLAGFLAFFAMSAAWALSTPLTAVPDEPAHIVKAVAAVRGQIQGHQIEETVLVGGVPTKQDLTGYEIPSQYGLLADLHYCYFLHPKITADCAASIPSHGPTSTIGTSAGQNNPVYYFAVGWPTLLNQGEPGIYAMRLVSAAIGAALLASAVVSLAEWRRRRGVLMLGLVAAATPMTLWLNGSVNHNGVEAASGILVWCALLGAFCDPRPELLTRRITRATVASVVLLLVRPLGPAWIAVIVATVLLVAARGAIKQVLTSRATWIGTGAVTAAALGAFAWSVSSNVLITSQVNYPEYTFWHAAAYTLGKSRLYLDSMVGLFGWLDVRPPAETQFLWMALGFGIAAAAVLAGRRRDKLAVIGLMVAVIALPILAQAKQAAHLGYIWQGRYLLAVAVGVPLLATTVLARRPVAKRTRRFATRRTAVILMMLYLVDAFVIFYGVYWRYAIGSHHFWFSLDPSWTGPGGMLLEIVLYCAGAALLASLVLAGFPAGSGAEPAEPKAPEPEDSVLSGVSGALR